MKAERLYILENQERAYLEGIVEKIGDEWILIERETEEAFPLEEFSDRVVQVKLHDKWIKGILMEDFTVKSDHHQYILQHEDLIRIRKTLTFSFQSWLDELNDDSYFMFIEKLNELNFSIYDILYCHNYSSFLTGSVKSGVNFLLFDNTIHICAVQHHFTYDYHNKNDRFEFTLNTGKRMILQEIHRPEQHKKFEE